MFELIFTFFVNIVGDFFDKKFLTLKNAVGFTVILNVLIGACCFIFPMSIKEKSLLFLSPNIIFVMIWLLVFSLSKKTE